MFMVNVSAMVSMLPEYAELQCFSNFSFLHGASHAEELAQQAAQLGYSALAITDECSLAGVVRAYAEAKKAALPFIIGSYFEWVNADGPAAINLVVLEQLLTLPRESKTIQPRSNRRAAMLRKNDEVRPRSIYADFDAIKAI